MKSAPYLLFFIYTTSLFSRSISSLSIDQFLGISPQDVKYYKSSGDVIKCKDGSKKFTRAQLNDDFCDCPDGSDEPGTSACPGGKFYCRNSGHVPLSIFSSRVNDGICDCCDGSDEYNSEVKCPNTCWGAGKMARDNLKKKISTYQEGVTLRKQEVEQAKVSIAKDEAELSKLKSEEKILKGLVQQLKERKDLIEKAEEEQRLQREKEKAKTEDAEIDKSKANETDGVEEHRTEHTHDKIGILENTPLDQDVEEDDVDTDGEVEPVDDYKSVGHSSDLAEKHDVEDEEVSQVTLETDSAVSKVSSDHYEKKEDDAIGSNEDLSKEELGRLVASRWTGENTRAHTEEDHPAKHHDHEDHQETSKDEHDNENDGYASDSDDDNQIYDDTENEDLLKEDFEDDHDDSSSYMPSSYDQSDYSDITTSSGSSWLEKIQQTVRNIIDSVNVFKAPVNISDADHVRKEYGDSSSKLTKIQSRISSLTNKLKQDFGPNKEFYSFYDHCFETKQNKYVYKVCPYKQASQSEGHHSTTRLGNWDKFEDSYRTMLFSNGEKCWNGPDRSLKVKVRCGLKNEVADVDEPSRCEYVALLSTPTLCLEEKLKELQEKLELMIKEQPQNHDEL